MVVVVNLSWNSINKMSSEFVVLDFNISGDWRRTLYASGCVDEFE